MKTIRKSIFETNSSSTHSVSIDETGTNYGSITPDSDGNIVLEGGEFGWKEESHRDPLIKANYCAIDQFGNEKNIEMLKKVLIDQTGATNVIFDFSINCAGHKNWSWIDHQSAGISNDAFESEETLRNFIFSKYSILHTDNDNH